MTLLRQSPVALPAARASQGFTLWELLIVVVLLTGMAVGALPNLAGQDEQRLDVAASEVRDALRFARAEALRRGKPTLLDAETTPGTLKVLNLGSAGCSSYSSTSAAIDPRSKRAYVVDIGAGTHSTGVSVTPRFLAGTTPWGGLVFDASGEPSEVCQVSGSNSKGTPAAGSQVLLSLGGHQAAVNVDVVTGRVSGP